MACVLARPFGQGGNPLHRTATPWAGRRDDQDISALPAGTQWHGRKALMRRFADVMLSFVP